MRDRLSWLILSGLLVLPGLDLATGMSSAAAASAKAPRRSGSAKSTRRAWLGTALSTLSSLDRKQKRVPHRGGVLVLRVLPRSPAARIGLRAGDVLMRLDRKYVFTATQVIQRIAATPAGRTVQVDVIRNGHWLTARVRLSPRPAAIPGAAPEPPARPHARQAPRGHAHARQAPHGHAHVPTARAGVGPRDPAHTTDALRRRVTRLEREVKRLRRLVQRIRRR